MADLMEVTINAAYDRHPDHRPFTVKGAVAAFVEKMEVGEKVVLKNVFDPVGEELTLAMFRMNLSQCSGGKRFVTRKYKNGLCIVYRAA
jgi:hypothetical protein